MILRPFGPRRETAMLRAGRRPTRTPSTAGRRAASSPRSFGTGGLWRRVALRNSSGQRSWTRSGRLRRTSGPGVPNFLVLTGASHLYLCRLVRLQGRPNSMFWSRTRRRTRWIYYRGCCATILGGGTRRRKLSSRRGSTRRPAVRRSIACRRLTSRRRPAGSARRPRKLPRRPPKGGGPKLCCCIPVREGMPAIC